MSAGQLPAATRYELPRADELPASRASWPLTRERAALLVHDMQAYFVAAFAPDAPPVAPLIANLQQLVAAARACGVPVFYTAQRGAQDPAVRGLQGDLWGPGMRAVSEHAQIVAALTPAAGEVTLTKHRYSAFQRSALEAELRTRGRDQLIIGGVYAHIGCLFTAVDAFQRDVQPFVVGDAVADFSRTWHDAALAEVADCCGVVMSTTRALEALR